MQFGLIIFGFQDYQIVRKDKVFSQNKLKNKQFRPKESLLILRH